MNLNRPRHRLPPSVTPDTVDLEECCCPHGCKDEGTLLFEAQDRINGLPGRFSVVRCNNCGLIRTNPRPTAASMGYYYPSDYGPYLGTKVTRVAEKPGVVRRLFKRLFDSRSETIPSLPPGKALEIGCASGRFLSKLHAKGWAVTGVEFSPSAAEEARRSGFTVFQGPLEEIELPTAEYDLIVGWMVLEHLHHPLAAMRKLHAAAAPGAWLAISVPNCEEGFRYFGPNWFPLHLPNHLFHFSEDTLRALLDAGGWEIVRCLQQRLVIDWPLSIGLALQAKGSMPWLSAVLLRLAEGRCGLLFNIACYPFALFRSWRGKGERMTVWARRKDSVKC